MFFFAHFVKRVEPIVGFAFAAGALRELVGGESFRVARRFRQRGGFGKKLSGVFVVVVLVAIETRQRFVELRALGIVPDPALEEILAELEIFALGFDAKREPRLGRIVHRGRARIPGHVPRGHVPKQNRARLERRDLAKQQQHAAPFRSFPRHVRLNEESIGDQRTKTTQRRNESQLAELLAQSQIEIDRAEMQLSMRRRKRVFHRQLRRAEHRDADQDDENSHHNSLR